MVLMGLAGCGSSKTEEPKKPNVEVIEPKEIAPEEVVPETVKSDTDQPKGVEPAKQPEKEAEEMPPEPEQPEETEEPTEPELKNPEPLPAPENAVRLSPTEEVWINRDEKKVYVGGQVALRHGMLEMFACPRGTKEHESVIAVNSLAATVHAALLAVGAVPGTPVTYDPEYKPPTGTEIDITVEWKDPEGKWQSASGREWVRNVRTDKELDVPWVFAGSGFYVDEETGKQHYLAESGDLICVSNFGSAMLDLPVESSQAEAGLLFDAYTERIPALGTPVRLVLTPKLRP